LAEPTQKDPSIEAAIRGQFGMDRREAIKADQCQPPPMGCGSPVTAEFRDEDSKKEFAISGLCQRCQDSIWGS